MVTGATKPETLKDSDADFNLGAAIGALNMVQGGVWVCMNGIVYPPDLVKRDPETGMFVRDESARQDSFMRR